MLSQRQRVLDDAYPLVMRDKVQNLGSAEQLAARHYNLMIAKGM